MRRCVIIGGADIGRYDRIRGYLREGDFYICCDSGLKHREGLDIVPDLIVGDFDSYENPQLNIETITLPREKDDTDTICSEGGTVQRLPGFSAGRCDRRTAGSHPGECVSALDAGCAGENGHGTG